MKTITDNGWFNDGRQTAEVAVRMERLIGDPYTLLREFQAET